MRFYQEYLFERGTSNEVSRISLSLQSAMTPKGPITFALIADGRHSAVEGEYAAKLVAEELTGWFWNRGISLFRKSKGSWFFYSGFRRVLMECDEQLKRLSQINHIPFGVEVLAVIRMSGRLYAFRIGNAQILRVRKLFNRVCIRRIFPNLAEKIYLGDNLKWKMRATVKRIRDTDVFFLCTKNVADGFSDKDMSRIFLIKDKDKRSHIPVRLHEMAERLQKRGEGGDICGVYMGRE